MTDPAAPPEPGGPPVPGELDLDNLSTEGILVLDVYEHVLQANERAHELIPGLVAELAGSHFWDVIPERLADEHQSHARRALQSGRTYTFLDHDEFAGRWIEYVMGRQGGVTVVHLRNVSDRHRLMGLMRESERRAQALFEANPNIMWVFEISTLRMLAANRAAMRFYGFSREDFLALDATALYPDNDEKELRKSLPAIDLPAGTAGGSRLCKQRKRDGTVQVVELWGIPVEWSGKRGLLVTVTDVNARYLTDSQMRQQNTELEEKLKERTQALQDATRELESLQYAMSHDMQTPLHSVDGFTQVLMNQFGPQLGDQGMHYLTRIKAVTEKMARLIDDLRMLSRVSRLALQPGEVELGPLCTAIFEQLRKREPQRQAELELEPGMRVLGDPELITTALAALIGNAWKFTSRKEQTWVKIGLSVPKNRGDKVIFVSDNGAGYDTAYAAKLFTPFQRLHSSADFPGTGLGLAIVQRVAMRHGGQVWSESTPMAGATFYLSLPGQR